MVKYKVLAKPGLSDIQTQAQGQKFIDKLRDEVFPMLDKWWTTYGAEHNGREKLDINLLSFVQTWAMGSAFIAMAYDNDKPVGIFIGLRYSNMFYAGSTMQVAALYGDTAEIKEGLVDYVSSLVPAMMIDEVAVDSDACENIVIPGMHAQRSSHMTYWRP